MKTERWVNDLRRIAESHVCDFLVIDENGRTTLDMDKVRADAGAAIKSLTVHEYANGSKTYRIQLHDKHQAYRLLGEYYGVKQENSNA